MFMHYNLNEKMKYMTQHLTSTIKCLLQTPSGTNMTTTRQAVMREKLRELAMCVANMAHRLTNQNNHKLYDIRHVLVFFISIEVGSPLVEELVQVVVTRP